MLKTNKILKRLMCITLACIMTVVGITGVSSFKQANADENSINDEIKLINEENQYLGSFEINLIEDNAYFRNQIPSGEMNLLFDIYRNTSSNVLTVNFNYEWEVLPVFRYEDIVAVGWDGAAFTIQDNSFSKTDYYSARESVGNVVTYANSYETNPMLIAQNGMQWGAKLKDSLVTSVLRLYGSGEFKLIPTSSATKSITLYGNYVHKKPFCSVTVAFSGSGAVGSIGLSGVEYDSMGSSKTFSWR